MKKFFKNIFVMYNYFLSTPEAAGTQLGTYSWNHQCIAAVKKYIFHKNDKYMIDLKTIDEVMFMQLGMRASSGPGGGNLGMLDFLLWLPMLYKNISWTVVGEIGRSHLALTSHSGQNF